MWGARHFLIRFILFLFPFIRLVSPIHKQHSQEYKKTNAEIGCPLDGAIYDALPECQCQEIDDRVSDAFFEQ
jgi:hypothetical protein